jgi:RNA polymerase sigma factor (sigma-70 family)
MSSAVSRLPRISQSGSDSTLRTQPEPVIHVALIDPKRRIAVDPEFQSVAEAITSAVMEYRRWDLTDDAVRINIAEKAIYDANKALKERECVSVEAYVLAAFRRKVDRFLAGEKEESYDAMPEGCSRIVAIPRTAEDAERNIVLREALESMDPTLRYICLRRFLDLDSPEEIGRDLGLTGNAVSVRLSRGLAKFRALFNRKGPTT